MVTSSDRWVIAFSLTPGNAHDAPEGRLLLDSLNNADGVALLMDRAYESDDTRAKAVEKGFKPVVPPRKTRQDPWQYDKELYKRRNEIERLFLRLKRFRKVFTRYDKLDLLYIGVIYFALITDAIISVNTL